MGALYNMTMVHGAVCRRCGLDGANSVSYRTTGQQFQFHVPTEV